MNPRSNMQLFLVMLLLLLGAVNLQLGQKEVTTEADEIDEDPSLVSNLSLDGYIQTNPFMISSDSDFHTKAAANGWDLGGSRDGTEQAPYLISNIKINVSQVNELVWIHDTSIYFEIRDSYFNGYGLSYAGLYIEAAPNFKIINNTITSTNQYGLYTDGGNNTVIKDNVIENINVIGSLINHVNNSIMSNNLIQNTGNSGLQYFNSANVTLNNNTVQNGNLYGIWVAGSDEFVVSQNSVTNVSASGILSNLMNNTQIVSNTISYGYSGIFSQYSNNITITGNLIDESTTTGMAVIASQPNNVTHNFIYNTGGASVIFALLTNNTHFEYNDVWNATGYGFTLSGYDNIIRYNNFRNTKIGLKQAQVTMDNSTMDSNYWSDWTTPDVNNDNIVDNPYIPDGSVVVVDNNPQVYRYDYGTPYTLSSFDIIHPLLSEHVFGNTLIKWTQPVHSKNFPISSYTLSISTDNGVTTTIVVQGLTERQYTFDTSTYPDGKLIVYITAIAVDGSTSTTNLDIIIDNAAVVSTETTTQTNNTTVTAITTYTTLLETTVVSTHTKSGSLPISISFAFLGLCGLIISRKWLMRKIKQ